MTQTCSKEKRHLFQKVKCFLGMGLQTPPHSAFMVYDHNKATNFTSIQWVSIAIEIWIIYSTANLRLPRPQICAFLDKLRMQMNYNIYTIYYIYRINIHKYIYPFTFLFSISSTPWSTIIYLHKHRCLFLHKFSRYWNWVIFEILIGDF